MGGCWLQHRLRQGALQRVPRNFYPGIWGLLRHCRGLLIGDKLERRNRLDSNLLAEKTPGEQIFAVLVEHLLSKIEARSTASCRLKRCYRCWPSLRPIPMCALRITWPLMW
jgi:hypothetical protein